MPSSGNIVSTQGKTCTLDIQCDLKKTKTSKTNKIRAVLETGNKRTASDRTLYPWTCIEEELSKVKPTEDSDACGDRCLQVINSVVQQLGPEWHVQPFGSFANGFGTISSDLDITCCQPLHVLGSDTLIQSASALEALSEVLQNHPLFSIEDQILGARVPILKLRFENRLDIDMSCHNPTPLMNTKLLRAYSRIDSRISDLGIAIKLWAKHAGVCDAKNSHLSSYSFTLLVIYFLQVHPEIKLPILPVDAFADHGKHDLDERVIAAMRSFSCELTLAELLYRFFEFYCKADSGAFRWGSEVVSVRCGERRAINDPIFNQLRGRHVHRLHVEDPYQPERNLHSVLGENEENHLLKALWEAFNDMQSLKPPSGLIPESECAKWLESGSDMQATTPCNRCPEFNTTDHHIRNLLDQYNYNLHTHGIVLESCDGSTISGGASQFHESDDDFGHDNQLEPRLGSTFDSHTSVADCRSEKPQLGESQFSTADWLGAEPQLDPQNNTVIDWVEYTRKHPSKWQ